MDLAQHEIFRVKVGKGGINYKYINRVCLFFWSALKYSARKWFVVRERPPLSLKVKISSIVIS